MKKTYKKKICLALAIMALGTGGLVTMTDGGTSIMPIAYAAQNEKPDAEGYVVKTAQPVTKAKLKLSQLPQVQDVQTSDPQATEKTKRLLVYLHRIAKSGDILYGHQNDMHRKVGKSLPHDSDTYEIVNDYPAVVGMDGLALTGNELELTEDEKAQGMTLERKLANVAIKADKMGAIVTMSCHMPNFAAVAQKPKIDGQYDYRGYSPNDTSGDVVRRILPGGDLNEVFTGYLDKVVTFDKYLQEANVPLIFRPFHENTGSWFWWGAGHCTPEQFRQLFHYTEHYLQGKGLHNILYAYSPGGGEIKSAADYHRTYPGNASTDILGLDIYHRNPEHGDGFLKQDFPQVLKIVQDFAQERGKVAAVTETGMLVNNSAMSKTKNKYRDWFIEAANVMRKHNMAYFMTWSNFDETNFDQPYMIDPTRGHALVNAFVEFYNDPHVIFAAQNANYAQ